MIWLGIRFLEIFLSKENLKHVLLMVGNQLNLGEELIFQISNYKSYQPPSPVGLVLPSLTWIFCNNPYHYHS